MTLSISALDGDGVGPEIISSAVRVLDATELDIEFVELPVGLTADDEHESLVSRKRWKDSKRWTGGTSVPSSPAII